MKIFLEKKGLVLAEAIVTISILVTCALVAGAMFTDAVTSTAVSKDFLIANGLAIEGAEAVRNIVATNKMLDPNDPSCWLRINPATNNDGNCGGAVMATAGSNYLPAEQAGNAQTKGKWLLTGPIILDLDLSDGADNDYLLYINNGTKRYTTSNIDAVPSKFYRSIKFSHADDTYATFEVKVAWFEGVKPWSTSTVVDIMNQ